MTDSTQPEALRLAAQLEDAESARLHLLPYAATELRRLHTYCQELEAQVTLDCMTHVQNPAEIEHVTCDVSQNWAESNMSTQPATQQEAQEPVAEGQGGGRMSMLGGVPTEGDMK